MVVLKDTVCGGNSVIVVRFGGGREGTRRRTSLRRAQKATSTPATDLLYQPPARLARTDQYSLHILWALRYQQCRSASFRGVWEAMSDSSLDSSSGSSIRGSVAGVKGEAGSEEEV